jgi:hypothetical protein
VETSTADTTTFNIRINSRLSTEDAEMMMMDIKNYYLGTPLPRYEYMRLPLSIIPDEIITKNNLLAISVGGWLYLERRKGMYGLKQAGLLANQLVQQRLAPYGYYPARHTRDYGYIKLDQLLSHLLWITLQSSTWEKTMHTTCAIPYCVIMKSRQIGETQYIQVWHSSGIISSVLVTFTCLATSQMF